MAGYILLSGAAEDSLSGDAAKITNAELAKTIGPVSTHTLSGGSDCATGSVYSGICATVQTEYAIG